MEAQLQSSGTGSRSANPAQAEVIDGITTLRRNLRGKKIVQRLAVFRKRYDRWLTAETLQGRYNAQPSADMPGQTLQPIVIAKVLLEEQVSHMSDKQVQTKWKEESRKNKFWRRLVEEFGLAILQILSHRLTDEKWVE